MQTQAAMTKEEIQAKITVFKVQKGELETKLADLSKQSAYAMMAGEGMAEIDAARYKAAEDIRHLTDLIAALEQGLLDEAKSNDIQKFEKALADRNANSILDKEARQRLETAKREFKEAEAAAKQFDNQWQHLNELIAYYKNKLKKDHRMTDIEINQIDAKFKP